jgi:hypothetical protein
MVETNEGNESSVDMEDAAAAAPARKITVDLSADIGPIRDQGKEGASVGFAFAYALQAEIKRVEGQSVSISPRSIYVEAKRHDQWPGEDYTGTSVLGAFKALEAVGAYSEDEWPYERLHAPLENTQPGYRIVRYSVSDDSATIDKIISALQSGKTPIITVIVTTDFQTQNL